MWCGMGLDALWEDDAPPPRAAGDGEAWDSASEARIERAVNRMIVSVFTVAGLVICASFVV